MSRSCSARSSALIALLPIFLFGCNRFRTEPTPPSRDAEVVVSSLPPFKTKEPERYRATRITSSAVSTPGSAPVTTRTTVTKIFRAGANRREEYESEQGNLIYLENSNGRFVIDPAQKTYRHLNVSTSVSHLPPTDDSIDTNKAHELFADAPITAIYQPVGAEELNGRRTVKYLVRQSSDDTNEAARDTFIWIDDELGVPIRSQSTHSDAGKTFRWVTELRDISTQVDEKLFEIPQGFQRVELTRSPPGSAAPKH